MKNALRFALIAGGLIVTAAAPALADYEPRERWITDEIRPSHYRYPRYGYHHAPPVYYQPILPEHTVRVHLRQNGFHSIHGLYFDGTYYRARGRDGWGRPVVIVASAQTGNPVEVRPVR